MRLFLLCFALLLTACGPKGVDKVGELIADKKYEVALKVADKLLEKDKSNAQLHSYAAQAQWHVCVKNDCLSNADIQTSLAKHLVQASRDTKLLQPTVVGMLPTSSSYAEIGAFLELSERIPADDIKTAMQTQAIQKPLVTLFSFDPEQASAAYTALAELPQITDISRSYLTFLDQLVKNDINGMRTTLNTLAAADPGPQVFTLQLLAPTLYLHNIKSDAKRGAEIFATDLSNQLTQLNLKWLDNAEAQSNVGKGLKRLIESVGFMQHASTHQQFEIPATPVIEPMTKPVEVPAVETEALPPAEGEDAPTEEPAKAPTAPALTEQPATMSTNDIMELWLWHQELTLDPKDATLWTPFFERATNYLLNGGDEKIVQNLPIDEIPADAVKAFNERILALIQQQLDNGITQPVFFNLVIAPTRGGSAYISAKNKLLREAIKRNLELKDATAVLALSNIGPEVARQERQEILKLMLEEIDNAWQADQFDYIIDIAGFLRRDLEIEFNLDSLVLKNLTQHFTDLQLIEKLTASSPKLLLLSPEEAKIDLGPKFAFAQKYFASNPLIIDAQLKKIVRDTPGLYGPASAMYALQSYFNDGQFPAAEREEFLVSSLKNALMKDEKLTPVELANTGTQLHEMHAALELSWLVDQVTERTKTLEEATDVWTKTPTTFKDSLISLKPQFTALMRAQELLATSSYTAAAEQLTVLRSAKYHNLASGFVEQIRAATLQFAGTWAAPQGPLNQPVWLVQLAQLPLPVTAADSDPIPFTMADLVGLDATLTLALGSQQLDEDTITFKQNFGGVSVLDSMLLWDSTNHALSSEAGLSIPSADGDIPLIDLKTTAATESADPQIQLRLQGQPPVSLGLVTLDTDVIPLPAGKFGITEQVIQRDKTTTYLLPTGSVLELRVNTDEPLAPQRDGKQLGVVLPVAGALRHPTSTEPLEVHGFYDIERKLTHLAYTYHLPSGAKIDARLRCQIVAQNLRCAGHHKHWDKIQYGHVVAGKRARGGEEQSFFKVTRAQPKPIAATEVTGAAAAPTEGSTTTTSGGETLQLIETPAGEGEILDFPDIFE